MSCAASYFDKNLVLCSHFTYANFDQPIPIESEGHIFWGENEKRFSIFDYGTFECEREYVYGDVIAKNKAAITMSGHSHRSGLYHCESVMEDVSSAWFSKLRSNDSLINHKKNIKVKGQKPCFDKHYYSRVYNDRCNLLVSGCGGPIGIQNQDNELKTWGLDYPSGSVITFNSKGVSAIKRIIPDLKVVPTAKPRLSVALDYADIIKDVKYINQRATGGVFQRFESPTSDNVFEVVFNPDLKLPDIRVFDEMTLISGGDELKSERVEKHNHATIVIFSPKDFKRFVSITAKKNITTHLSIKLGQQISRTGIFKHYLIDKWCFQIEILSRKQVAMEMWQDYIQEVASNSYNGIGFISPIEEKKKLAEIEATTGYIINRHRKFGEVPNILFDYFIKTKEYQHPTINKFFSL